MVFSPSKHKMFVKNETQRKHAEINRSDLPTGEFVEKAERSDLFCNIKCILTVGKLLFLLPCEGFNWTSHEDFVSRKSSFPSVVALLMILWCIIKTICGFKFLLQVSHGGVVGYVHPAHYFIISSIITFIYIYFFINFRNLRNLFTSWNRLASPYNLNVFQLTRMTWCAVMIMILPCIINTLFSLDATYHFNRVSVDIPLVERMKSAYEQLLKHWHNIVPFSAPFTIFCTLDFIWGSFPRSFVISLVIVFSYAISRQFKDLVVKTTARLKDSRSSQEFWLHVVKKHNALTDLVAEFDSFLSPLIFITYMTSLYLICMQLLRALSSTSAMRGGPAAELTIGLSTFIFNASFCVEVFLLYFMSISAAQLNTFAHEISNVLRECPVEYHISDVARLENRVNFGPRIGFTGLGCFVITKPFLLTIANAVLTLEIILLQAQFTQPVLGL